MTYYTADPAADALHHEDEQERREAEREHRSALLCAQTLARLQLPGKWQTDDISAGSRFLHSPDDILHDALYQVAAPTPEIVQLYCELMTSPAAAALREALANYWVERNA